MIILGCFGGTTISGNTQMQVNTPVPRILWEWKVFFFLFVWVFRPFFALFCVFVGSQVLTPVLEVFWYSGEIFRGPFFGRMDDFGKNWRIWTFGNFGWDGHLVDFGFGWKIWVNTFLFGGQALITPAWFSNFGSWKETTQVTWISANPWRNNSTRESVMKTSNPFQPQPLPTDSHGTNGIFTDPWLVDF